MKIAYGTLGWHVEYLQPAIRRVTNLERLVFYYGYVEKAKKHTIDTRDKMIEICEQLGLQPMPRELPDPFDFVEIVKQIKKDVEQDINADHDIALFNIAGGTKPMCAAALMVCIFKGLPTLYVNEETLEEIKLPLLQADYLGSLTRRDREIVQFLFDHKNDEMTQAELARQMGIKRGTLNPYVQRLEKKGILKQIPSEDGRGKIVKPSEGMELLFE